MKIKDKKREKNCDKNRIQKYKLQKKLIRKFK